MPKEVMRRSASDNTYLHKDFHGALSCGIEYLDRTFGPEAVRDYLRQFAKNYYAPVCRDIARRGLPALRDHLARVYGIEGGRIDLDRTADTLTVTVRACPAVAHMRANGYPVARRFGETTRTLNRALCEDAGIRAELLDYDAQTGRAVQRFTDPDAEGRQS